MRVLLIRPNSMIRTVNPPLGLGYLSSALKGHGHQVSILDARHRRLKTDRVVEEAAAWEPDVVGLSVLHTQQDSAYEVARAIKEALPSMPVVLGGPYASSWGESVLDEPAVDVLVLGEGDETLPALLEALEEGTPLGEIEGIIYREEGEPRRTEPRAYITDLDRYQVDWDGLQPRRYFSAFKRTANDVLQRSSRVAPVFTSRGCPYGCIYCHNNFGRQFRARSAENVVDEMELLVRKHGVRNIEIMDDYFNLDLDRAKAIMHLIQQRGLRIQLSFPGALRADQMDKELIELLDACGAVRISYAIESAAPRIQKLMRKNLDLDRASEIIDLTAARGILTTAYFMIGFPTETEEELMMTVDFALNSKLHIASFFYVYPFPGTPLAEKFLEEKRVAINMPITDFSKLAVNLSAVPDGTLRSIRKIAYRRFYLRPRKMLDILRVVPWNIRTVLGIFNILRLSLRDSVNY